MNTTQCPECLSTRVGQPDPDGTVDCLDCGIYWQKDHPNNQRDAPRFGYTLLDGPNPLECAVCEQDHDTYPPMVIARWHERNICTDCLEHRPGKEEAEAEARGERPVMTQEEYREAGGGLCPRCQSPDSSPGRIEVDSGIIFQKMACLDCDLEWHDLYRLAGYARPPETPEGQADDAAVFRTAIIKQRDDEPEALTSSHD